jgi:eukaryotic-like serine/threonine-protein kinase
VVFAWNGEKQDNFDIYVKLIGSGLPLRLTSHPAEDFSPAWSPDGRWIAFLRNLPGGKAAVLLIPPIGGPERKLAEIYSGHSTGSNVVGPFLAWSRDGNWLVIVDQDSSNEPSGLFLLSIETGEKRRLTSPPAHSDGDSSPAFAPDDGHTLAFSRWSNFATSDLNLLALSKDLKATGEAKRLTFDNRETSSPVWTLDGREIIFSSGVYGVHRL